MANMLICLFAIAACAAAFDTPLQYTTDAVMMLPYAGISEPVRVYYDGINNKSRTEYYNGQDITIYRPDMYTFGTSFVVIPETYSDSELNIRSCVQLNGTSQGATTLQSIIPDLSLFKFIGNASKRGVLCEDWYYGDIQFGRQNSYHFYVSVATQAPVQFYMSGYDFLLGSHYDIYTLNFLTWNVGPISDPSVFNPPNMTCGNFPGPGSMQTLRGALSLIEDPVRAEEEIQSEFKKFGAKYGKVYSSDHDLHQRMNVFRQNVLYINSMNRRNLSFKLAVNHLADYLPEELKTMRGSKSSRTPESQNAQAQSRVSRPDSLDWRDKGAVSPVKDQGICGSCWSFATAQTIESANFIKTANMVPLSPQSLVDCSWGFGNNGCDGGEAERAFGWIMQEGGLPTEASYGVYEMADGLCHNKEATIGAKISSYVNVTSGSLDAVADALYTQGPLSIAIDAGHLSFVFYSSGVFYEPTCGNTPDDLDHAVLLVGYGVDPLSGGYWIVKNSWSEYWGDQGYVKMSQKDNNCGVTTDTNYVNIA